MIFYGKNRNTLKDKDLIYVISVPQVGNIERLRNKRTKLYKVGKQQAGSSRLRGYTITYGQEEVVGKVRVNYIKLIEKRKGNLSGTRKVAVVERNLINKLKSMNTQEPNRGMEYFRATTEQMKNALGDRTVTNPSLSYEPKRQSGRQTTPNVRLRDYDLRTDCDCCHFCK
eukprot:SAG11_NODE_6151_length_1375_cov_1.985904_3_plen_170_part_00